MKIVNGGTYPRDQFIKQIEAQRYSEVTENEYMRGMPEDNTSEYWHITQIRGNITARHFPYAGGSCDLTVHLTD